MKPEEIYAIIECEESQEVCKAFRARGFIAFSNDIQQCSGVYPHWHLKMDAREAMKLRKWDLVIAHPPCTYLANSGVRWLYNKDGSINKDRWEKMEEGAYFFKELLEQDAEYIGIENPIMHKHALKIIGVKPTQIIQPWQFGHGETKATCLWLKNLPMLKPTDVVSGREQRIWKMAPGPDRQKMRSKTYEGIAKAFASQWGDYILNKTNNKICVQGKLL